MEDVCPVAMYVDAADVFAINITSYVRAFLDH